MDQKTQTSFKVKWLQTQFANLRKVYSPEEVSNDELKTFLLNEYEKRKTVKGRFYNNSTKDNKPITIEGFINYFLNNDYLLTGYNVLIENQKNTKTIAIEALEYILGQRKIYKKKMEAAPKGSADYIYYKVLQLTFKILANSYYGILSMAESIFYNSFIQNFAKKIHLTAMLRKINSLICWKTLSSTGQSAGTISSAPTINCRIKNLYSKQAAPTWVMI